MANEQYNLLWLTENYYPNRGGMAQSCDRITHTLRTLGTQIDIIHFTNRKHSFSKETVQNGSYIAFPFEEDAAHTLNLLWNYLSNPKYQKSYTHIVAYGGNMPILAAPVFAQWLKIPLITLIRGNDFDTAIFTHKRRDSLFYALNQAAHVCAISDDKVKKIKQLFPSIPVTYIPNGIDITEWITLPSNEKSASLWKAQNVLSGYKVIGLFGDLKPKKGFSFFLEALRKSQLINKIHLLIAGEIMDETRYLLGNESIHFTALPFLDRFELLSYYPACDAIAIPSFYDGMPNVLLEAGVLGIPFIASNVDGMKDVLDDGMHGFLFHPFDIEDCANAIIRFADCPQEKLKEMGKECAMLIALNYTHEMEGQKYLKILKNASVLFYLNF
jgi:glycogen synthase